MRQVRHLPHQISEADYFLGKGTKNLAISQNNRTEKFLKNAFLLGKEYESMHNNAIKDIDLKNVPPPTLQKKFYRDIYFSSLT